MGNRLVNLSLILLVIKTDKQYRLRRKCPRYKPRSIG